MNKTAKNVLIALAVGGSIFLAGQVVAAQVPEADIGRTTTMMGLVAGSGIFAALNARKGNRKLPTASGEGRAAALAFPPNPGGGHIVVARLKRTNRSLGYDVMLDGVVAAQLMAPQFVVLPVASGTHILSADIPGAAGKPADEQRNVLLAQGEVLFFEARSAMGLARAKIYLDPVSDTPDLRARLGKTPMVMPT